MKTVAAPLPIQIAVLILGPPLLSALLWLALRLFGLIMHGSAPEDTQKRQKDLFWASLKGFYIVGCLLAIGAWLH